MPILTGSRGKKGKSENQKIMDRIMGDADRDYNNPKKQEKPKIVKKSKKNY